MYCTFESFKSSPDYQTTVNSIIKTYSTKNRPITSVHFQPEFLKSFYIDNVSIPSNYYLDCYERLLNFFLNEREKAIQNENIVSDIGNKLDKLKDEKSILDKILDVLSFVSNNIALIFFSVILIIILFLILKLKKEF